MKRKHIRQAFTLVELLVVMAVMAILIGAMVKVAGHVIDNAKKQNTQNTIQLLVTAMKEYQNFNSQGRRNFEFPAEPYPIDYSGAVNVADWRNWWKEKLDVNLGDIQVGIHLGGSIWDDDAGTDEMWMAQANIELLYFELDDVPDCRKILNQIPSDVTANADNDAVLFNGQMKALIEVNDAWGHPLSYQTQGVGNFPLLRSAGRDGIFFNADDILSSEM